MSKPVDSKGYKRSAESDESESDKEEILQSEIKPRADIDSIKSKLKKKEEPKEVSKESSTKITSKETEADIKRKKTQEEIKLLQRELLDSGKKEKEEENKKKDKEINKKEEIEVVKNYKQEVERYEHLKNIKKRKSIK